jgi:antitoxin component YwqK of YwqJK toxin-antitoxin module
MKTKTTLSSTKSKHKIRYKKNGEKIKYRTTYYEGTDVIRKQVMYIGGKKDGCAMKYYKSGQIYTITHYVRGVQHGNFYKYDESGNIIKECTYVNGKKHGVHILYFDASVIIKQSTEYRNGIKHGKRIVREDCTKGSALSVYKYYEGELYYSRYNSERTIIEES